ncbi:MAG: MGMT family protein [Verrucomicrobiota bacterium]
MPTPFQQRVYDAVCEVPKGKVTTYQLLAEAVSCGSSQAIGQALKRNPYAPDVPCHRVIRADLTLGGFAGQIGGPKIDKKQRLLAEEGVEFDGDGQLKDQDRVFDFSEREF